mgnify:CR=1 FL=1
MNVSKTPGVPTVAAIPSPGANSKLAQGSTAIHLAANTLGAILILSLGIAGYVFFGRKPEVPTDTSKQDAANVAPLVDIAVVKPWDQPFHLDIDGEASTYRILTVGAEVTGRVANKPDATRSGTFVNKGDVLFQIDAVNYEIEEQRLQARVAQAAEELKSVDVDIQNTTALLELAEEENQLQKNHLERIRSLFVKKATSESDMDTATQRELTSRNAMQMQQNQLNTFLQTKKTRDASLKLAQAELKRTITDLQRCLILSPITGRIVDDIQEEGDYVKLGDPLVHISDSSRMEIKCSLKSEELAWVWQQGLSMNPQPIATSESAESAKETADGKKLDPFKIPQVPCEIAFEFQGVETIWDGHLSRYEGTGMDRATRMFPCRVVVEEPEKTRTRSIDGQSSVSPPTLLSGMYVTVRIPIKSPIPLLQVPAESVRPGEQLWIVRDGKLHVTSVTLVRVDGESALVRPEGGLLIVGDKVIISPLASVNDGMPVLIQAETSANESAKNKSASASESENKP